MSAAPSAPSPKSSGKGPEGRLPRGSAPGTRGSLLGGLPVLLGLFSRIPIPSALFPSRPVSGPTALFWCAPVGALLGALTGGASFLLRLLLPPDPAAWIALGFYVLLGWGLHLDGWTDCWDGFGSGRRGEALRAVMKDSRVGGFGAAGLVLALGAWSALTGAIPTPRLFSACCLAAGMGRCAIPAAAWGGRYPWESGMGLEYVRPFRGRHALAALLASLPLAALDPLLYGMALPAVLGIGGFAAWGMNRRLGGVNGDVLGASAVAGELACLALALLRPIAG